MNPNQTPNQGKQMSEEERQQFLNESATLFARLFLEQVLQKRRAEKDENDQ